MAWHLSGKSKIGLKKGKWFALFILYYTKENKTTLFSFGGLSRNRTDSVIALVSKSMRALIFRPETFLEHYWHTVNQHEVEWTRLSELQTQRLLICVNFIGYPRSPKKAFAECWGNVSLEGFVFEIMLVVLSDDCKKLYFLSKFILY